MPKIQKNKIEQYTKIFIYRDLNKMRYILWVVALLEACDVINNGRHLGRHLGLNQELEIRLKQTTTRTVYSRIK